jgi:hypothetical protein
MDIDNLDLFGRAPIPSAHDRSVYAKAASAGIERRMVNRRLDCVLP